MRSIPLSLITLVSLSAFAFAPVLAGEAEDSVNKFFLDYQSRVRAAKDMTELTPYLSKNRVEQITNDRTKLPPAEFKMMFEMIKMMVPTKCQIVKTEIKGQECNIQCTADGSVDPIFGDMNKSGKTKETTTGNIHLVKEGANWKLEKESWKSSFVSSDGAAAPQDGNAKSCDDKGVTSDSSGNSTGIPDSGNSAGVADAGNALDSSGAAASAPNGGTVNGVTVTGGEVIAKPDSIK